MPGGDVARRIHRALTEPSPSVVDPIARRQVRLVSSLIIAVTSIALVTAVLLHSSGDPRFDDKSATGIHIALVLLVGMYALSRTRHYRVAIWSVVTITTWIACPVAIANPQDPGWFAFATLTPIIAGTLLPLRRAVYVVAGHILIVMATALWVPGMAESTRIVAVMVAVMGGGLVLVAANYRNAVENIRQEELERRDRRHREVLDVAFDGIAVLEDGRIAQANRGFSEIFQRDDGDLVGARLVTLFDDDARAPIEELLRGRVRETLELRTRGSEGRVVELVANAHERTSEQVEVVAVRDITKRRQTELELQHSQRLEAVGRLAGGVAHDFNNLLMVLGAEAELLREEVDEVHSESLDAITEATNRAADLTRQLLAFSRRQFLRPKVVDLHTVLESIRRLLTRTLGEDVVLRTSCARGLYVQVDPGQLEQVILNLAVNARDAMPTGGRLTLCGRQEHGEGGECVLLEVSDTGEGIEKQHLEHVFEPFFTTKAQGKGTGLGLAVVHGIVEQSGGEIVVSSSAERGTSFEIRFPLAPPPAKSDGPAQASPQGGVRIGQTILLVEDEVGVAAAIERMLAPGNRVLVANSALEAAAILDELEGPLDLAIIDIVLQDQTGVEVARDVRKHHPGVAVLHISGYADEERARVPSDASLLLKPFTTDQLRAAVRAVQAEHSQTNAV